MHEEAILNTVTNLQRIFAVILALALGEAFKQFVSDKAVAPEDREIRWDRLMALVAFLLLLIPFYHGIGRYFYDTYQVAPRPANYAPALILDSFVFTLEGSLFFVMSRALPLVLWRRFYAAVLCILTIDVVWGVLLALTHTPYLSGWIVINSAAVAALLFLLWRFPANESRAGPTLALLVILARAIVDYWVYWSFYFPEDVPLSAPL